MSKRIVVCLDGTWNSPHKIEARSDASTVFKPTNVLKMARAVRKVGSDGVLQLTYYDSGVGSQKVRKGVANRLYRWLDHKFGGVWGTGFESRIERAYSFIAYNIDEGDELYIFGFSRGAGQARSLSRFISWAGGFPRKSDVYFIPILFDAFIKNKVASAEVISSINTDLKNQEIRPFIKSRIAFLGVWETVLALGSKLKPTDFTHSNFRSAHTGSSPADYVDHARHALAIDEERYDFRPDIWETASKSNKSMEQRWFAGVHSNIGGGYVDTGLANIALHWMVDQIKACGLPLALNSRYLAYSRKNPLDTLYNPKTLGYHFREAMVPADLQQQCYRTIAPATPDARIVIDDSVFERLNAENGRASNEKNTRLYRPENLLEYLRNTNKYDHLLSDVLKRELGKQ